MICSRCGGKVFLDRTFTDNKNYETFCVICGDRKFVAKNTRLGKWLADKEQKRMRERSLSY